MSRGEIANDRLHERWQLKQRFTPEERHNRYAAKQFSALEEIFSIAAVTEDFAAI